MEWKQPEGLRRHWVNEEIDGELMFAGVPYDSACGRVGDEEFALKTSGVLRPKRELWQDGECKAVLECRGFRGGGEIRAGDERYTWKPVDGVGNRWELQNRDNVPVCVLRQRTALTLVASVELSEAAQAAPGWAGLLILCWYDRVLAETPQNC